MQEILTIADLKDGQGQIIKDFLENHDFSREMEDWALAAAKRRIFYDAPLEWNRPRLKKVFHPSALSGDCDFKLFLDLWGAEYVPKQTKALQMIFDTGTAVHGQLDYLFMTHAADKGYEFIPEIGFKPTYIEDTIGLKEKWVENETIDELGCSGHADGQMTRVFNINGKKVRLRIVFEFKTISSGGFRKLTKPHLAYTKQVHAYMTCLDVAVTVILYINKDNSNMAAFPIIYDPKFWLPLEKRLRHVKALADSYQEPDKKSGSGCRSCGYLEVCGPPLPKRRKGGYGAPEI